jgi:NAD(P)-dependent dehydrogenase (short-subunit alcohol dehydrogenase family)
MASKQVILITGASTGFGRLMAETFARAGHTVFATMRDLAGRNATSASEIRALASEQSLLLHVLELDVTDEASVDRAVATCVEQAGRIDVAINNAGYVVMGLAETITLEQARAQMDTNFFGSVRVNRAVLPHMHRQQSGLLLHISSGAGRIAVPGMAFYCASKFALEALAEVYRYELAGQGIESSVVEPGPYETPIFERIVKPADLDRACTYGPAREIPQKVAAGLVSTFGNAQEVADGILAIIETSAGQRKLRYSIAPPGYGTADINEFTDQVQARVLESMGLTEVTTFAHRSAANSA